MCLNGVSTQWVYSQSAIQKLLEHHPGQRARIRQNCRFTVSLSNSSIVRKYSLKPGRQDVTDGLSGTWLLSSKFGPAWLAFLSMASTKFILLEKHQTLDNCGPKPTIPFMRVSRIFESSRFKHRFRFLSLLMKLTPLGPRDPEIAQIQSPARKLLGYRRLNLIPKNGS